MSGYTKKEIWSRRENMSIYGVAYIPEGDGPWPLVIIAHGFCGTFRDNLNYAEYLAEEGIASYSFDFCGGSNDTRSTGTPLSMSVMTEKKDLLAVVEQIGRQKFVDSGKIFLMGESQGGIVAALAAAELGEKIRGSVLLYPAFVIPDFAKETCGTREHIPERFSLWDVTIGRDYFSDVWDLDVYGEIVKYRGPVLIFHGSRDKLVPLSYSERARDCYADARLVVMEGLGHSFYGEQARIPARRIIQFVAAGQRDTEKTVKIPCNCGLNQV